MKHYYEVLIDGERFARFYSSKSYKVGNKIKRAVMDFHGNEVQMAGTITSILSHEEF